MTDPTRAAYESALHKLNELSGRLAIGRENDDYLHRLANAAQNVAIAAREVYAEAREKDLLCSRKSFSRAWAGESMARSKHASLPDGYALEAREDGSVVIRHLLLQCPDELLGRQGSDRDLHPARQDPGL